MHVIFTLIFILHMYVYRDIRSLSLMNVRSIVYLLYVLLPCTTVGTYIYIYMYKCICLQPHIISIDAQLYVFHSCIYSYVYKYICTTYICLHTYTCDTPD